MSQPNRKGSVPDVVLHSSKEWYETGSNSVVYLHVTIPVLQETPTGICLTFDIIRDCS